MEFITDIIFSKLTAAFAGGVLAEAFRPRMTAAVVAGAKSAWAKLTGKNGESQ